MAKQFPTLSAVFFGAIGKILAWLVKRLAQALWRLIVVAVCHPRTTAAVAIMSTMVLYVGWITIATVASVLLLAAIAWRRLHGQSYERLVGRWVRTWWRRWWAYRRQWVKVFARCQLTIEHDGKVHVPKLREVYTTPWWDRLVIEGQIGQEAADYRQAAERLREAFGAIRAVVRPIGPGRYGLDFMRRDPLVKPVQPFPIPKSVKDIDFRAIPIGLNEYGVAYTLSVLGGHTAAAGATGAGKAGVIWNLLRGLGPAIAANWVRPVLIDPKGRELRQGKSLAADEDYVGADPDAVLALLVRLVAEMDAANERDGASGERDFEPGPGRQLVLILIDELAPLLRYWSRSIRTKIEDALGLLLTQGRAAGFIVVGAVQEPTKDTFTIRDLFQRRIALRLPTESHTEAALIEDAVEYGARCHEIDETKGVAEGVFYSLEAGARSTIRARLSWVQDQHITELVTFVDAHRDDENVIDLDSRRTRTDGKAA
jgi:S-DNA-T family DNA segregation ATPase FtsK/SpoIIIE